jgi:PHD/YefM family antitoxin component YafN of YafNO toxin-antitoxin module
MDNWSTPGAVAITTRDLSKNPSKALRDVGDRPLIVMRHQRPIACLVSIEQWTELIGKLKDIEMNTSLARTDLHAHSAHPADAAESHWPAAVASANDK